MRFGVKVYFVIVCANDRGLFIYNARASIVEMVLGGSFHDVTHKKLRCYLK